MAAERLATGDTGAVELHASVTPRPTIRPAGGTADRSRARGSPIGVVRLRREHEPLLVLQNLTLVPGGAPPGPWPHRQSHDQGPTGPAITGPAGALHASHPL